MKKVLVITTSLRKTVIQQHLQILFQGVQKKMETQLKQLALLIKILHSAKAVLPASRYKMCYQG